LLIEDDSGIRDTLQRVLVGEGHESCGRSTRRRRSNPRHANAFQRCHHRPSAAGTQRLELVQQLHRNSPAPPYHSDHRFWHRKNAIEATKLGAYDYVLKPFDIPEMLALVAKPPTATG